MIIKIEMSLNIGIGQGRRDKTEMEVPDNWYSLDKDEQHEILQEYYEDWASNFIDGHIKEIE